MLAKWKYEKVYFDDVVTCDELWLYDHGTKMKRQSTCCVTEGSAPLKKMSAQGSTPNIMVIIFWDQSGVICMHYYPARQTVNTVGSRLFGTW